MSIEAKTNNEQVGVVRERPLSPHLTIYKPQMTSVLSIGHRFAGAAVIAGGVFFVFWLCSLAFYPKLYGILEFLLGNVFGKLIIVAWTAPLFFHIANGIRHYFWDVGLLLELNVAKIAGVFVVLLAGFWTVCAFTFVFFSQYILDFITSLFM